MRFAVIGAGGHSKEVVDLLAACGHETVGFVDEGYTGVHATTGLPVVADLSALSYEAIVLAIGDNGARSTWYERASVLAPTPMLVHPTAVVSPSARLGEAVQVMQNVVVNASAIVAEDCILNVACSLAHDCVLGAHTHIAPGARMGGGSSVGPGSLIGTNATVMPGVHVGRGCTVGAGAVVVRDMPDGTTGVGVPARPISARDSGGRDE